ncbi:glycoside hydrolase family 5 protein [Novipirellula artificiosorum]|uniref:Cellulase (Glycosyl hydrolase family 5) n=1 Tax=Novipirellula artificiosorum TaxID=2528016 RepID=A0A5C6D9R0_9BACT|nr:cellulase family glycosylhydrolase [Novipirellula artificiosorum]TWU32491.1 hypothetical protein Poly41_54690 [Novipirellula artificiosorum]
MTNRPGNGNALTVVNKTNRRLTSVGSAKPNTCLPISNQTRLARQNRAIDDRHAICGMQQVRDAEADDGDPTYVTQLDDMVRMGREAGLQTVFKLVVYDLRPFGDAQWDAIYQNTDGTQDALVAAWSKLWIRYKDEPSVFGYDLLNEPQRGLDPDEERCCSEQRLPTLRRLADALHAISPSQWALYQPLYKVIGTGEGPFLPMPEPFGRERVVYAPHLYSMDLAMMNKTLARPRPLVIAGHLQRYGFDFTTRTLEVSLSPDATLGSTEIFVSADRFYPDGFRVEVGSGIGLSWAPGDAQLHTVNAAGGTDREQAGIIQWNADSLHLVIKKWIISAPRLTVRISPQPKRP